MLKSILGLLAVGLTSLNVWAQNKLETLYDFENGGRVVNVGEGLLAIYNKSGEKVSKSFPIKDHETFPLNSSKIQKLMIHDYSFFKPTMAILDGDGTSRVISFKSNEAPSGPPGTIFRNFVFSTSEQIGNRYLLKMSSYGFLHIIDMETQRRVKTINLEKKSFQIRRVELGRLALIARDPSIVMYFDEDHLEIAESIDLNMGLEGRNHFNFPFWFADGTMLSTTCDKEIKLILINNDGTKNVVRLPKSITGTCRMDTFKETDNGRVMMIYGEGRTHKVIIDSQGAFEIQ